MRKTLVVLLLVAVLIGAFVSCKEEPAHEHTWDAGKVTTPATCEKAGVKTYTCSCGETKTEAIPALGHDYSTEWTIDTPATCTDPGSKSHHCSRCTSKSDVSPIEALGHDYSEEWTIDTPATCTEPGSKSHHCSRCTSKSDVTPIEATGHTYSDEWSSDADNHWHAATCGHDVKSDIAAHTWGDWANTTPATVLAEGVDTKTCSVCGATETRPVAKLALEVSTFEEFVAAFAIEREAGTPYTIKLTANLAWDAVSYTGADAEHTFSPDMTGITLDLNEHSITGIANKAFAPTGNTFTIKNGSVLLATGLEATYLRAISVNFSETLTYADHTTEAEQAKAVTFDGITTNGCLYLGGGAFIIKDSTIESYGTKTRGICSYSAYVDVTNSTVKATNGEVAIHARDTVLNLNNGTTVISPTHGIQAYYKSTVTTTGTVTITAAGAGYDIYLNYGPNTLTIGAGTTISGATKGVFALTFGDTVTIANGASITGPAGGVEPKYTAAGYTKAAGTASTNGYVGWSKGNNNTSDTATITDNRVLE